jgi:hypothetical protein
MTIEFVWAWGGFTAATLVCGWACLRGGWAERVAGATLWVAWVDSLLIELHGSPVPGLQVQLIDVFALVVFTAISLKARRLWMLLLVASQLDDVFSHVTEHLLHYGLYSYITATGLWGGQFLTGCLAAGMIGHRRRSKSFKMAVA